MASAGKAKQQVEDAWMGLNPAAQLLDTTRYRVLAYIVAGDLETKREAGRDLVTRASVMVLKQRLNRKTA